MPKNNKDEVERQRAALDKLDQETYAAIRDAEDAAFELQDRDARRGARLSPEAN